jgi:hypothetical protein
MSRAVLHEDSGEGDDFFGGRWNDIVGIGDSDLGLTISKVGCGRCRDIPIYRFADIFVKLDIGIILSVSVSVIS